jgi:hypothetical protein
MPKPSAKTKFNKNQLRELFTEQMYRAIDKRGFVDQMYKKLDEIQDPEKWLRCSIELLKFVMPQLAAQKIEVEQTGGQVERVVFTPLQAPRLEEKETKLA